LLAIHGESLGARTATERQWGLGTQNLAHSSCGVQTVTPLATCRWARKSRYFLTQTVQTAPDLVKFQVWDEFYLELFKERG